MQRAATSTQPEDIFVDLFREVFGLEKAQMLVHEFPYRDFLGNHRFVDYALKTTDSQVAFEIDGPDHYNAGLHQGLGAFLPMQQGDVLELRAHQKDAREWLDRTRAEGKSIALLQHATRTRKNVCGQRYINHRQRGSTVLLFVREDKRRNGLAAPYCFLGPADYVSHEGSRPMSIVWRLRYRLPA